MHTSKTAANVTSYRPIIYLASPYTHADVRVRCDRYQQAVAASAKLVSQGLVVFSPIVLTHPIDHLVDKGDASGLNYWIDFDESFMIACSEIRILCLDGWEQSKGIAREREFFAALGRPESFINPPVVGRRP